MEPARHRPASRRDPRPAPRRRPRAVAGGVGLRVRWDRVGRVALLLALAVVGLLYVDPATSLLSSWRQSGTERGQVRQLGREHRILLARRRALDDPRVVAAEARRLGLVLPGEIPYVVTGLRGAAR